MVKKRHTKDDMQGVLQILAKVTSAMSMLFVGHTFGMSEDGFEFINLAIKTKKNNINKPTKITRQDNVIKLKPK